jgi:creatinine amidohydrolase
MNLPSRFWADLTSRHFSQLAASSVIDQTVAVLPVAAIEQHGPHLPVSVDTTLVDGVIEAALPHLPAAMPVLFMPTQQVGKSNEHIRYPGTLTLSAQTLISVWMELGACVARAGIKKLLLFNSHGGQVSVMDIVARDLRTAHDLIVFSGNWFTLPLGDEVMNLFNPAEHRFGIHAGDMETSMMLALRERYVDMRHAQHFHTQAEQRALEYPVLGKGAVARLGWQIQDYNPYGAAGDATQATAARGHAVINAAGLQLALLLQEISSLPLSTLNAHPYRSSQPSS